MKTKITNKELQQDIENHPNLSKLELTPDALRKCMLRAHRFMLSPDSMIMGYVYQKVLKNVTADTDRER